LLVISVIGVEVKEVFDHPVVISDIREQEKRLLISKTQQLDNRIVGRRVLVVVATGSFGDTFEA